MNEARALRDESYGIQNVAASLVKYGVAGAGAWWVLVRLIDLGDGDIDPEHAAVAETGAFIIAILPPVAFFLAYLAYRASSLVYNNRARKLPKSSGH